jgi:starch-binding outer membrane protein, SusD/RagB family
MKRIKYILLAVILSGTLHSCHDLEVEISTQLTEQNFPTREEHFIAVAASSYSALRSDYAVKYWFLQTLSTDEAIIPARGGNWYDQSRYEQLHKHTWTADHGFVLDTWNYLSNVVANANKALALFGEGEERNAAIAELRVLRALAYYMMMDLWGNIPIVTNFGDITPPSSTPRAEVFAFLEKELQESLPYLSTQTGVDTYGRPNKYTAFALLAKLYINAEVYTGTQRLNDAIVACDSIISSGKYQVESDYRKMFFIDNGPQIKEFIFAIPFSPTTPNGYMLYNRYWLPRSLRAKYSLNYTPSAPMSTIPSFYAYFNDENDIRKKMWLTGKQYMHNGSPIIVNTTKKGFDEEYTGEDANNALAYHVELTPDIILRGSRPFDCGNDEKAWNMGYRNIKFYPDSTSSTRNQNTDVPVFRYSDILLMKAEAIIRGGTATLGHTAVGLVNEVRSKRTSASALASVDLEFIYEERTREFVGENWHRNDMIRFGKFENTWGFKTDTDINKRLYPIPSTALQLNPLLDQNDGY